MSQKSEAFEAKVRDMVDALSDAQVLTAARQLTKEVLRFGQYGMMQVPISPVPTLAAARDLIVACATGNVPEVKEEDPDQ